jgi:hypothetical protein
MNETNTSQPTNEKVNGLALVFVSMALLLFAVMIVVYVYSQDRSVNPQVTPTPPQVNASPTAVSVNENTPRVIVPFFYTVESVSNDEIVLSAEEGLMNLSPSITSVYFLDKTNKVELQNLTVGAKVRLEMNPGEYNWLYIQE